MVLSVVEWQISHNLSCQRFSILCCYINKNIIKRMNGYLYIKFKYRIDSEIEQALLSALFWKPKGSATKQNLNWFDQILWLPNFLSALFSINNNYQ